MIIVKKKKKKERDLLEIILFLFFFLQKSDFDEKFLRSENNLKYAQLSIRMHDDFKSARNVFRYM